MKSKAATIFLTAFAFNVSLLSIFAPAASGPGRSLQDAPGASNSSRQPEELFEQALAWSTAQKPPPARLLLPEIMRLWIAAGKRELAVRAALQLGYSYEQVRRYDGAWYCFTQALKVKPVPDAVLATTFNSLARVYANLYRRDLSLSYYNRALKLARLAKDGSIQEAALIGLADIYYRDGKLDRAADSISKARQLNRQLGNEPAEAALLHLEGQMEQERGKRERAREAFNNALTIYRKTGDPEGQVKTLCALANLDLDAGHHQAASELANEALKIAKECRQNAVGQAAKARTLPLLWHAWLYRARTERALGKKEAAKYAYLQAIAQGEADSIVSNIHTEASAAYFRAEIQDLYRELVDLLIEQGKIKEAYDWAENAGGGRTLLGLMTGRRMEKHPESVELEPKFRERSRHLAGLRTRSLSSQISPNERAKIELEIKETELALEEMRVEAEMKEFRKRLAHTYPVTFTRLQGGILQNNETLLQFYLGEDRSYVWLISPEGIFLETLPGRKEIERSVNEYLKIINTAPDSINFESELGRAEERAEKLFSSLFGRLAERIAPGRKLIVVPDGLLNYLPFEALVRNGCYLVEDHEISYLPSASTLNLWLDSGRGTESTNSMEFLAFGDPIFGPGLKTPRGRSTPGDSTRRARAARGFSLERLPRTRDEVEFIAGLFPPGRQKLYLDKDSTEESLKKESLRRYKRLHFATHSLIDESSPSQSSVVLTLDSDPDEDGFLEVGEIVGLDLDCDLVVLSACQTGRGELVSGEGVLGLSRAFLYAGARSVVVTLWNVSDISTGRLMKSFYKHLADHVGNSAALRQAKLGLLRSGTQTRHPYHWASFVITGKP